MRYFTSSLTDIILTLSYCWCATHLRIWQNFKGGNFSPFHNSGNFNLIWHKKLRQVIFLRKKNIILKGLRFSESLWKWSQKQLDKTWNLIWMPNWKQKLLSLHLHSFIFCNDNDAILLMAIYPVNNKKNFICCSLCCCYGLKVWTSLTKLHSSKHNWKEHLDQQQQQKTKTKNESNAFLHAWT